MPDRLTWSSSDRFVFLYALAWAGGTIAYTPLLTIILPVRIAALVGAQAGVAWLAKVALTGAVFASLGGIVFGYLSDISRNRAGWIAAGLVISSLLLLAIGRVSSLGALLGVVAAWQLALNMMLGPLAAWAADRVPDDRKGLLGGLMAFAPGIGALSGALVTHPGLAEVNGRLGLVASLVALFVIPILVAHFGHVRRPAASWETPAPTAPEHHASHGHAIVRMWFARLAVQIAESTLFSYLFFWLHGLSPQVSDNLTARLFSTIMLVSAPLALALGRWSDVKGRPIVPLQSCALLSALGLLSMSLARDLQAAMLAYALFGVSSSIFLALHSAQTLRILPRPERRGRDLGLFNLANTVPSLVMPWLALACIPVFGFSGLFAILAVLAALAGFLLSTVAKGR